jgi:flagellar hook protein FlgE
VNSGNPVLCKPFTNGAGKLNPGTLEMSNVDLTAEFADMIVTQRGFQANSRIITTTDEMLEEIVNMVR